jgi:hypothetical protein
MGGCPAEPYQLLAREEEATALLLSLPGADACWPLHDAYGLPLARFPDVIANAVRLIVEDWRSQVRGRSAAATK